MKKAVFVIVALVAAVGGYGIAHWYASPQIPVAVPTSFSFPDLRGESRSLSEWQGKRVLVNFWATWCAPCREEVPILVAMQKRFVEHGLQIIGIATWDNPSDIATFQKDLAINYPVLLGADDAITLMEAYGNPSGGLPFSVLLDENGHVIQQRLGALSREDIEAWLATPLHPPTQSD